MLSIQQDIISWFQRENTLLEKYIINLKYLHRRFVEKVQRLSVSQYEH